MITSIGLLGPVLPLRGGIAQHTTTLHRSLRHLTDLKTISFSRHYPKWLYPGEGTIEPGYEGYREPEVSYSLDWLSPSTWTGACRSLLQHNPKAIVIPWWTVFWAPCFSFIASFFQRKNVPVVFIVHNVLDHEAAFWKLPLTRLALRRGSYFLVQNQEAADALEALVSGARISVHPYPVKNQLPSAKGTLPRRARLELLFFGFVRPYKGLDVLLEAIRLLKDEDVFLTVAGEWWTSDSALRMHIEDEEIRKKVELVSRYIPEQEAVEYFTRADVVVLPYRRSFGSAVVPLAYSFGKPVIATSVGGLHEIVWDGVSGRLVPPGDPHALAAAVREFLSTPLNGMEEGIKSINEKITWESFSRALLNLLSPDEEPQKVS